MLSTIPLFRDLRQAPDATTTGIDFLGLLAVGLAVCGLLTLLLGSNMASIARRGDTGHSPVSVVHARGRV